MNTKVFGKKIENHYIIKNNQKVISDEKNYCDKLVFTAKPTIEKEVEIVGWLELCAFEGEPRYNKGTKSKSSNPFVIYDFYFKNKINISSDEEVFIDEEIFRADLNELHLHTDKIVEENDSDREYQMNNYEVLVDDFNEQMILSNEKLHSYCKLHNLAPRSTDCIELFKLIFPNEEYVIEDGVMKVKEKATTYTLGEVELDSIAIAPSIISACISGSTVLNAVTTRN